MIKFHGISMPEGAALSWPLSVIVIRRKNGFAFRCRVRGCSLLDQRPVSALPRRLRRLLRRTGIHVRRDKAAFSSGCKAHPATAPAGSNRGRHGGDEMSEAPG